MRMENTFYYYPTKYEYCVYHPMSKKAITTGQLYWKEQKWAFSMIYREPSFQSALYCSHFLLFALNQCGTRRMLFCILNEKRITKNRYILLIVQKM